MTYGSDRGARLAQLARLGGSLSGAAGTAAGGGIGMAAGGPVGMMAGSMIGGGLGQGGAAILEYLAQMAEEEKRKKEEARLKREAEAMNYASLLGRV